MGNLNFKVHRVLDGPREDEQGTWWLLCFIEDVDDQEMFDDELPFNDLDSAYKFKRHFETSIDPIVLSFEVEENFKGH